MCFDGLTAAQLFLNGPWNLCYKQFLNVYNFTHNLPKVVNWYFLQGHRNVSKCAKNQFSNSTQWEIKPVWKFWRRLLTFFFQNEKIWNTQFYGIQNIDKGLLYPKNWIIPQTYISSYSYAKSRFFSTFLLFLAIITATAKYKLPSKYHYRNVSWGTTKLLCLKLLW